MIHRYYSYLIQCVYVQWYCRVVVPYDFWYACGCPRDYIPTPPRWELLAYLFLRMY